MTSCPLPIRTLLIGAAGHVAHRHLHATLCSQGAFELVAMVDPDAEGLHHVRRRALFRDFAPAHVLEHEHLSRALLEELAPDLVVVCSPNHLHAEHIELALNARAHVLCEKPVTLSSSSYAQLLDLARRRERVLLPAHQLRLYPSFQAARELLRREDAPFGRLHGVHLSAHFSRSDHYFSSSPWRGTRAQDGGLLWNQLIHLIDWMVTLLDHLPEDVHAHLPTSRRAIDTPDQAAVAFSFDGGVGTINASILAEKKAYIADLRLMGERGELCLGGDAAALITRCTLPERELWPAGESSIEAINDRSLALSSLGHRPLYEALHTWLLDPVRYAEEVADMQRGAMRAIECIERIERSSARVDSSPPV